MEGFTWKDLEAFEVDLMPLIEVDVASRKIVPTTPTQLDRTEEACRPRRHGWQSHPGAADFPALGV